MGENGILCEVRIEFSSIRYIRFSLEMLASSLSSFSNPLFCCTCSAYGGDSCRRCRRADADFSRSAAGTVPQLAVRTGVGQSAVESGLQRHPDERGPAAKQWRVHQHQNHQSNYTGCLKDPVCLTGKKM